MTKTERLQNLMSENLKGRCTEADPNNNDWDYFTVEYVPAKSDRGWWAVPQSLGDKPIYLGKTYSEAVETINAVFY